MKFLLDVNIAASAASFLQRNHHDLSELRKKQLLRLPDKDLVTIAKREKRIVLTHDKDFIELTLKDTGFVSTVINLKDQKPVNVIRNLQQLLQLKDFTNLKSGLVLITEKGTKIFKTK